MRNAMVLLVSLCLAGCEAHLSTRASASDAAQISAATVSWVEAYNSRDPARISALYHPEAVLWGTVSSSLKKNADGVADYFKDARKRPDARVSIVEQAPRVYGDIGINSGAYTFTDVRDGKAVTNAARFSFVFYKRDGRWMILDHHSSRMPAN